MLVRCLPASVQSARSVFEKHTHDLRAFHSITDSTNLTDNLCLEANTERSESNPGRSLGIKAMTRNDCLEDSTSHRAKHPCQSYKSVFEKITQW